MTYAFDADLLREITAGGGAPLPRPAARDDWKTLRSNIDAGLAAMEAGMAAHPEISRTDYTTVSHDGATVSLRWYAPAGHTPRRLDRRRFTCTAAG